MSKEVKEVAGHIRALALSVLGHAPRHALYMTWASDVWKEHSSKMDD